MILHGKKIFVIYLFGKRPHHRLYKNSNYLAKKNPNNSISGWTNDLSVYYKRINTWARSNGKMLKADNHQATASKKKNEIYCHPSLNACYQKGKTN